MAQNYPASLPGTGGLSSFSRPYTTLNDHSEPVYYVSPGEQLPKYGTVRRPVNAPPPQAKGGDVRNMMLSWIAPWAIFSATCALTTFSLRHRQPELARALTRLMAFALALVFLRALGAARAGTGGKRRAAWSLVLALSLLVAFGAGLLAGDWIFSTYTEIFYTVLGMNTYYDVNPSTTTVGSLMDGARFTFSNGSKVDVARAIGFMNKETYCVAPIVKGGNQSEGTFDFWAVGKNCCSGRVGDFGRCAEYRDPSVHAGLLLMEEELRPSYRLAVQQAEVTFNIRAAHPTFFTWLADPDTELRRYEEKGYQSFGTALLIFLVFQGIVAGIAAACICSIRPKLAIESAP